MSLKPHYNGRHDGCPLCETNEFDAGFIDQRLKDNHWPPDQRHEPDYLSMKGELEHRFGIEVSTDEIEEHWKLHVSLTLGGYREWARKKTKHSPMKDPYGAGMVNDEY